MLRICRLTVLGLSLLGCFVLGTLTVQGESLRLSIPPLMGALPIAFANAWGTFADHGVDVQLVGLSDNQTRNLALIAGQIDGMVCDVPTAVLLAATGTDIVITSTIYRPTQTGSLALLTQSYFNINTLAQLMARTAAGNNLKSIAVTAMSDLEYETDALLAANGYTVDPDKDYSYWYDLLQISTFLSFGSVYAAVLPEPYVTYIGNFPPLKEGTHLVHLSDFDGIELLPTVIVFRSDVVETHRDEIQRFYDAVVDAIDRVNGLDRDELIDTGIDEAISFFFPGSTRDSIPEGVLDSFVIPKFGHPDPLRADEYDAVVAWAHDKGYVWRGRVYADVTTTSFCP
jgi:NitT/TauT family transport system substrate-binding protein